MKNTQLPVSAQPEIGLLDLMVTLADNCKLLILGPLVVGLITLAITFAWPQTFESVAIVEGDQTTVSVMTSTAVLDPVIISLGQNKDETLQEARRALLYRIKAVLGRDKLVTLTVRDESPKRAQATAHMLLAATYEQMRPRGTKKIRIERSLVEANSRLENSQLAAAALEKIFVSSHTKGDASRVSGTELPRGYSDLLAASGGAQTQVLELEADLEGMTDSQLVQAPTLPDKAVSPKKGAIAVGATLASGFLLLLFVFIRNGLRSSAADPVSAAKLARIRSALSLR